MHLSKCHIISIINDEKDDEEEMTQPFVVVKIGKERVSTYVFVSYGEQIETPFSMSCSNNSIIYKWKEQKLYFNCIRDTP